MQGTNNQLRPPTTTAATEMLEAARLAQAMGALPGNQSHGQPNLAAISNALAGNGGSVYPDLALFSQFGSLFGGQSFDLAALQNQQKAPAQDDRLAAASRGRTRSSDSRSSSAYASRHQAAEQRRRTRINER